MPELNKLYSSEFGSQVEKLKTDFNALAKDLLDLSKGFKTVDDGLKQVAKSREALNKQQVEAEKLRQQKIKSESDIAKKEKELKKVLQEQEKLTNIKIKGQRESVKLSREENKEIKRQENATKNANKEKLKEASIKEKNRTLTIEEKKAIMAKKIAVDKENKAIRESITGEKASSAAKKEANQLAKKEAAVKKESVRETKRQAKATEKATKESEKAAAKKAHENRAYVKLNKTLGIARNKAKDLGAQYGTTNRRFLTAQKRTLDLDRKIKNLDKSLGLSQRNVGNYGSAFKGAALKMAGFAAGFVGIQQGIRAISGGVKVFAGFDKSLSELQAITGGNSEEMAKLQGNAERLGASTQKTAQDVLGLSIEFAKLGFTTKEIDQATAATLKLSIASGSDLSTAAKTAASTVRGFGLDASETNRVVDVMAKSFTSSGLDMEKFSSAMASAQVAAKSTGRTLEETTAFLSAIVDTGTDASKAGTDLRVIFSKLAIKGIDLNDAMDKVENSSNKVATAQKLVGDRAFSSLITLSENRKKTDELTKSYLKAAGTAKRMADIMADNLAGDADKAKSAMEGLAISTGKRLNDSMRDATQGFANFIGKIDKLIKLKPSEELANEQKQLNILVGAIKGANTSQKIRNELINELQIKYPGFLGNLNSETVTNGELATKLKEVNAEYDRKIRNMVQEEIILETANKQKAIFKEIVQLTKDLEEARIKASNATDEDAITGAAQLEAATIADLITKIKKKEGAYKELGEELNKSLAILEKLNSGEGDSTKITETNTEEVEKNTKAQNERVKSLENIGDSTKDLVKSLSQLTEKEREPIFKQIFGDLDKDVPELTLKTREATAEMLKASQEAAEGEPSMFWKLFHPTDEEIEILKEIAWDTASIIGNGVFDINKQRRDNELILAEDANKRELILAGDNIIAQRVAERKLSREKARIDREQAKADKAQAIFNIGLDTAKNIVKFAGNPILLAAVIALGGIQAGIVAAKPLPKIPSFDKGSESLPGGSVELAEKRPEFIIPEYGKPYLQKSPITTSGLTGARVIGGAMTQEILNQAASSGQISDSSLQMAHGFNQIKDSIKDISINFGYDSQGQLYVEKNNRDKIIYADYYKM